MNGERRHLVLVGLMGAGKTTVGERCADHLERPFVDTDLVVETTSGMTVAEVFAVEGEAGFRAREQTAVMDACASPVPLVIACGGGAVTDAENRRLVRGNGFVVWLRAKPPVLADRVATTAAQRPLLGRDGPVATLERLALARGDLYEKVADAAVDTDSRVVDEVVDAVLALYPT